MDRASSERWVVISAVIVAGVYAYRRLTEPTTGTVTAKRIIGLGNPVPLGSFAAAWGFTFLVVSVIASASPGLGGGFAILIATSDLLTNTASVVTDVKNAQTVKTAVASSSSKIAGATTDTAGSIGFLPGHHVATTPRSSHK